VPHVLGGDCQRLPYRRDATRPSSRLICAAGALAVLIAYSLPLLLAWARTGHLPNLLFSSESIYSVRVLDAYRGGTLASPYLAGHDNAPRYMPELVERALALVARATRVAPLTLLAFSRVAIPLLIFVILWRLARALDLPPLLALVAALVPELALSAGAAEPHFLRYMRLVSPAVYVLLLTLALYAWLLAWKRPKPATGAFAAISTGALFYTPVYYWSFAIAGGLVVAIVSVSSRRWLLVAVAASVLIGAPALWHAARVARLPDVQQTLHRMDLLTPGRAPDLFVLPRFLAAAVFCAFLWTQRHRLGANATYLLAFLVPGSLLLVQNLVTNRHAQSYHWIECLIPVGAIALAALLHGTRFSRPMFLRMAIVAIFAAAIASHAAAYLQWEGDAARDPLTWRIDQQIPSTINWLNTNTAPHSVLLARNNGDELAMLLNRKLYYADYSFQHVVSDAEYWRRYDTALSWDAAHPTPLPYAAHYFLGFDTQCASSPLPVVYRNFAEGTCVLDLRPQAAP
jgi:hypothetical protein